ncbi:hypothetical protein KY289_031164 [Solanum tuberosum]|nr:hypothetical protein KY289_031164 [Solanum tuberosum]
MRHVREPLRRSSGSYEGSFELILVMGWERELNSMRSNLLLFLSSSVVERSAVNRLVNKGLALPVKSSHRFSREVTIAASKDINDEEGFFVMLLILALLFCPSWLRKSYGA